jgi:hypothetical protein
MPGKKPIKVHTTHLGPNAPRNTRAFSSKDAAERYATTKRHEGYRVEVEDTRRKRSKKR